MSKTKPFDEYSGEYEQWFSDNYNVFQSELEAIRRVLPQKGCGFEIGIGSGIFADPLGIKDGIDPSEVMRKLARERGLRAIEGVAENLPVADKSYDFALMVTTICFVDDLDKSFKEAYRILKDEGFIILGFVDKDSPVGKLYLESKDKSTFYKDAVFFSTEEVYEYLRNNNFRIIQTIQTVFGLLNEVKNTQLPEDGYGKGSFVVIKAQKI